MTTINAADLEYDQLNRQLKMQQQDCVVQNCLGHRFLAVSLEKHKIVVEGIAGNALGAYLNGALIVVKGNAQDAVGDTMNDGTIIVEGNIGDAAGYAMRGGKIFVKGDAGYRAGVHMKEYQAKTPTMIIGGRAGSFLGEYQAGGRIVVLGLNIGQKRIVGNFPCTGMHGGKMFLRSDCKGVRFPEQVSVHVATKEELEEIRNDLQEYCELFGLDLQTVIDAPFTIVTPDSKNPYKQMYVAN